MSLESQLADYGQHLRRAIAELEVSVEPGDAVRPVPGEAPPSRRRWPIAAAAGLAAAVAVVLAVLFWPRSGDPTPVIDQGSTVPNTTITVPMTTGVTGTTMAAHEVLWDASLPVTSLSGGGQLVALAADDAWVRPGRAVRIENGLFHLHDGATFWLPLPEMGNQLAVTPDGTLWMAAGAGVFSFDGEAWTRRFVRDARALTVDGDGTVWVGGISWDFAIHSPWLARWDGQAFVGIHWVPPRGDQGGFTVMAATPDGSIWGVETGYLVSDLYCYDGGTMGAVQIGDYRNPDPSGPVAPVWVFELEASPDGDLWVGGFVVGDQGQVVLARFDGEQWTTYDWPFPDLSDGGEVVLFDLAVGPDGTLWVNFPGGLGSYDGATWSARRATTPFLGTDLPGLVDVAPDGTVWYSDGDGLHTFTP